jgi:hypothetical protein
VPVEVLLGSRRVEVRPYGVSKGTVLAEILEELGYDTEEPEGEEGDERSVVRQTSADTTSRGRRGSRRREKDEGEELEKREDEAPPRSSPPTRDWLRPGVSPGSPPRRCHQSRWTSSW